MSALLGLDGFVVPAQQLDEERGEWWLAVETIEGRGWCPGCGVRAAAMAAPVEVRDLPMADRPVVLVWAKRLWRCPEPACPARTWEEESDEIAARAVFTERARAEIARLVGLGEQSVAQAARDLGCWHAAMAAVREHGGPASITWPARPPGAIGWTRPRSWLPPRLIRRGWSRASWISTPADLSTSCLLAALERSPGGWQRSRRRGSRIRHVVIDPYQPYATAVAKGCQRPSW